MGGPGSGMNSSFRHSRQVTTDHLPRITIRRLRSCLRACNDPNEQILFGVIGRKHLYAVRFCLSEDAVFVFTGSESRAENPRGYWIFLDYTESNLCGHRPWFLCPGCNERRSTLFLGKSILCRDCHGLTYRSKLISPTDRANRRRFKAMHKLRATSVFWLPRPKGMHWSTYERLKREFNQSQNDFARRMFEREYEKVESSPF